MLLLVALGVAMGGDLAHWESVEARRFKVEAYAWAPIRGKRWDLDWRVTTLSYWSAILECERTSKRQDKCTFADDKIEHGYQILDEDTLNVYEIPADFWLEVSYSPKGKVRVLAKGERDRFYEAASNALIGRFHKPEGRSFKPDSWREIGSDLEDELRFWVAGALELQTPKDRVGSKPWKADAPAIAQTWVGGAYGGTLDMQVDLVEGDEVRVSGKGRFGEVHPRDPSYSVKGEVGFLGVFDTARGFPIETRVDVQFQAHLSGYYTKRRTLMRVAKPTDTFRAGEIEGSPLRP